MQRICLTPGCVRHAHVIIDRLNRSLNPCHDFRAYVCSAWNSGKSALATTLSVMDEVRQSWFPNFYRSLNKGTETLAAGRKPLAMYASCMGDESAYGSDVDLFRTFIRGGNLSWPERPRGGSALGVLMTLAFKWHAPLWFHLTALRRKSVDGWRFSMVPGALIPMMWKQHGLLNTGHSYEIYWDSFNRVLRSGEPDATLMGEMKLMEADILEKLFAVINPSVARPVLLPIAEMGNYTPSWSSDEWLRAIRHVGLTPEVMSSDQVLLSDEGFFGTLGMAMSKYTDDELLALISWSFVQLYAPAANLDLMNTRYGGTEAVKIFRPYFCERFVETAYQLLVIVLHTVSRFSAEERAFVSAGFDALVSVASSKVHEAQWLDEESRDLAAQKVASTRLHLWAPERYMKNEELEEMFQAFPHVAPSFAEYWINSTLSGAALYSSESYAETSGYLYNYAVPYLRYDVLTGTVNVAVAAVTRPLYYADGTNSMFYGGIGFLMALELLKSLDPEGIRWHPDGTFNESILSNSSTRAFKSRDGCLRRAEGAVGGSSSLFPEIPALEVAYRAYREAAQNASADSEEGVPGAPSGDQVFFLTACYMACTASGSMFHVDCNKAVRNFLPFAEAFGCPVDSAMNPRNKCSFLG
ncbi:hypothetical protein HPB48_012184 [Haemaphysalis longicornis]|uniref:Peptidase M13 N-terminal domain-containing protein n=1 Tax=Haemaphysalis longicornis TaxID=44386 RepID=A0A9J6GSJ5_HAELO|nr:hypothetical protein HPB48_012184 [Haemaphysalis longicornis]